MTGFDPGDPLLDTAPGDRFAEHSRDPQPGERIGDYEVIREVARGGMATVLEVRSLRTQQVLALKLLLPILDSDDARARFRREFRALSRLEHPNLVRVYEWGMRGDRPWFSMELLEGCDLRGARERCAHGKGDAHFPFAERVLVQVARALAYIHDHGLVHRDLTPGNIMIDPEGVARLMDFGVVKELGTSMTMVGEVIGTVAYMAPEQVRGESVDARADLYSLGAVLYFMLTGEAPFRARTLQGLMEKHLHAVPVPVRQVNPLVPQHLDAICQRLLAKDPNRRYASAHHLLHVLGDAQSVEEALLWPPATVGRTIQRARMQATLHSALNHGHAGTVLLTGEEGSGKSRLLTLAEVDAQRMGLPVARSRCRPNDRPYGPFLQIARALVGEELPAALRVGTGETGAYQERYPMVVAFRDLLVQAAPCAVLLDELEYADPATLELIEYLVHTTHEVDDKPVVFFFARQSSDAAGRSPAPKLPISPRVHRLRLEALVDSQVEELLLAMLPHTQAAAALAARLHQESEGNPAILSEMLRALHQEGVLVQDGAHFRLALDARQVATAPLPLPASLRQSLERWVRPLSPSARSLGKTLGVARRSVELDVLLDAAPCEEEVAMDSLDELVEAGIAVESRVGEVEKVDVTRHLFREVLLSGVSDDSRRAAHRRLGEALESHHRRAPAEVFEELAYHFEHAGLAVKAYGYLAKTGHRHLKSSLFEESLVFLERALRLEPEARVMLQLDEADRQLAEVHLARAKAFYSLGRVQDALEAAEEAQQIAEKIGDARLQSRAARELGSQLRNQGLLDQAEPLLHLALRRAQDAGDLKLMPMPLYHLGGVRWARGDLAGAEEFWTAALTRAEEVGDTRAKGFGLNGLGILAICQGRTQDARLNLTGSAQIFEQLGMLAPLSVAWMNLSELHLATGQLKAAQELAERTISKAREVQHPLGIAMGLTHRAMVLQELDRLPEAASNAREALRIARALGVADDIIQSLTAMVQVALVANKARDALQRVRELLPLLEEHDTEGTLTQAQAWHAQALAALGRKDEGLAVMAQGHTDTRHWPHSRVKADLARGRAARMLGRPDEARRLLTRASETASTNAFRFYLLLAHQELLQVVDSDEDIAHHSRFARSLSRSLSANLPREDATRFLARGWGAREIRSTASAT
ncbi:MAG: protein kinase [Deltaproteobacteria bacterium]|nr:protein kinase [Deltaproteobacteria bacterium]